MAVARKYFGTDGIRGRANRAITPDLALRVGQAVGLVFQRGEHRHRVVIGKDTRLSGYMIEYALVAGFTSVGMDVLLLGPMLELGDTSDLLHSEVGRYARAKGIDLLITVGEEAAPAVEAFGSGALSFPDQAVLHAEFPTLPEEHVVWVKGSRAAGLERTVAWLLDSEEAATC